MCISAVYVYTHICVVKPRGGGFSCVSVYAFPGAFLPVGNCVYTHAHTEPVNFLHVNKLIEPSTLHLVLYSARILI